MARRRTIRLIPATPTERALEAAPQDASLHRAMARVRHDLGDELGSLAHQVAAQTLESRAVPTELCKVATGYFMKGDHDVAERWYHLVLSLHPDTAVAHQNSAAIHSARGDGAEADSSRQRAYANVRSADGFFRKYRVVFVGRLAFAHHLAILSALQNPNQANVRTGFSDVNRRRIEQPGGRSALLRLGRGLREPRERQFWARAFRFDSAADGFGGDACSLNNLT